MWHDPTVWRGRRRSWDATVVIEPWAQHMTRAPHSSCPFMLLPWVWSRISYPMRREVPCFLGGPWALRRSQIGRDCRSRAVGDQHGQGSTLWGFSSLGSRVAQHRALLPLSGFWNPVGPEALTALFLVFLTFCHGGAPTCPSHFSHLHPHSTA